MAYGVTNEGFFRKPYTQIQSEMQAYVRAKISKKLQLTEKTGLGNVLNSSGDQLAELWEVAEACYHGFDKDNAFDAAFVALCELTGTKRKGASKGVVATTCNFAGSQTYAPGALVAHVDGAPDNRWVNRDEIVTTGPGNYAATFVAETAGAKGTANAGTLTRIAQPVSGWNSITNASATTPGTDIESLEVLYARREQELEGQGSGTMSAIRAAVSKVPGVIQVRSIENKSTISISGVSANSYRIIVWDGISPAASNDAIAQAIQDKGPGGVSTAGSQSGIAVDADGNEVTVFFDRAAGVPVYVSTDVSGSLADVAQTIVAEGSKLGIGATVVREKLKSAVGAMPGVTDISTFTLGLTASPVGTSNLTMTLFQIPLFDVSRVVVT